MINTVTTSTGVQIISPVYFLIFLVLVGFLYHLIRNKEYKDTLWASIIIGFIFGLIYNSSFVLVKALEKDLIFIILVMMGGFISVGLKKLLNDDNTEQNYTPTQKPMKNHNWWNKRTSRLQATIIIIICLLSIIMLINMFSHLNTNEDHIPVEDHVQLQLDPFLSSEAKLADVANDKEGTVLVISNNITEYTLKGSSEPNTMVKLTASEVGIINQTVPLDENSNFTYNLSIPQNVSIIKITIEAIKPGKDSSAINLTIKRQTS